jgi:hypothetical protein
MSWIDRINNSVFKITTGDGKVWAPKWKYNSAKSRDFNHEFFDFVDLENTFVRRKKARSAKYTLTFIFEGENNIEDAQAFEESAKDSRAWRVEHPYYGLIIGQPLSLARNDDFLNTTEVSVEFWETISDEGARSIVSAVDSVSAKAQEFNVQASSSFEAKTEYTPTNQADFKNNFEVFSARYNSFLDNNTFSQVRALTSACLTSLDNMIAYPAQAMQDINALISFAPNLVSSFESRVELLGNVFTDILSLVGVNLDGSPSSITPSPATSAYFESVSGAVVSAVCQNAITVQNQEIYTRVDIENSVEIVLDFYNNYLTVLDQLQTPITDIQGSFAMDFESQNTLSSLVAQTVFNLYNLSFGAAQERVVITERNSNLILLTHKYIGLDASDENISKFRKMNGIKNKELFSVKKGRKIRYFIQ